MGNILLWIPILIILLTTLLVEDMKKVFVFYAVMLAIVIVSSLIGGITKNADYGAITGLFLGGLVGGLAGMLVSQRNVGIASVMFAVTIPGISAGKLAGDQEYRIVVFYFLILITAEIVSFCTALAIGYFARRKQWTYV
jgi:hypothetical protein